MITINYGPWVPDLSNNAFYIPDQETPIDAPVVDCLNVYYVNGSYRSLASPVAVSGSPALPAQALQANTFLDANGTSIPFAGTATHAYSWQSGAWSSLGISMSSAAASWQFAQFGNQFFALPTPTNLATGGGSALFLVTPANAIPATVVVGAPSGSVMGVVGQFLMIGDIYQEPYITTTSVSLGTGNGVKTTFTGTLDSAVVPTAETSVFIQAPTTVASDNGSGLIVGSGVTGTINYETGAISVTFSTPPGVGVGVSAFGLPSLRSRLHWSPIGNPGTTWPTPLTNDAIAVQSGINDLEYAYGPVMFISGYPLYAVIFQRNAITRAQYIGGNVVFSWQTYARNQGLLAKGAAVQVGINTYFLSDAGFFSTDGANVVPIGTTEDNSAGMDQWFFSNVNTNAYGVISASYDASMRAVCFAIPTGSNTLPDTLLTYNIVARRWCRSAISSELIWKDSDGTNNRLGLISQSHQYQLLTGTPSATAYLESADLAFTDGNVRTTTAVRPNVNGTSPSVVVGNRNTLNASVSYSASSTPDAFGGGFAGIFGESLYTRVRVSSTNAQAINGATCDMVPGGPI